MSLTPDEAFVKVPFQKLTISFYGGDEAEARKKIKKFLDSTNFMINVTPVTKEELNLLDVTCIPVELASVGIENGLVWVSCHYDGTNNTAPITVGQPVAFDTVSGRAVTGINASWTSDEYKVVGIAWKSFSDSATKFGRIPVMLMTGFGSSASGTTTTSSTTTTTKAPCSGNCKWTWDAEANAWTLTTNNCNTTTTTTTTAPTTTTSSTTSSSTTSTKPPCPTTTSSTTTSSTTTSSTTTPPPCQCPYPNFCGMEDNECTFTDCTTNKTEINVNCTTTTTTSSTTTTTFDCNTTTTVPPPTGCLEGCTWIWTPEAGWLLTQGGCAPDCPCQTPEGTGADPCTTFHTPCVVTTTTIIPPFCKGDCIWRWLPQLNIWMLTSYRCQGVGVNCNCFPPPQQGNDDCGTVVSQCQTSGNVPGGGPGGGHGWPCYTTTSSTTTTTPDPCGDKCRWKWNENDEKWDKINDPCISPCVCDVPPIDGIEECQRVETKCIERPTTTTSTTTTTCNPTSHDCALFDIVWWCDSGNWRSFINCPPNAFCFCQNQFDEPDGDCSGCQILCVPCSTTTTTTTTTPTCPPPRPCKVYVQCQGDGGSWSQTDEDCGGSGPGDLPYPPTPCSPGMCVEIDCNQPLCTTTTTTTTTTDTTTTTTTTSTSQPPTTTTTSSTTTTTCNPCPPQALFNCRQLGGSVGVWTCGPGGVWTLCAPAIFCGTLVPPNGPCDNCETVCGGCVAPTTSP